MKPPLDVYISLPRRILAGIFDECDKYDSAETGGRILGFYSVDGSVLRVAVKALIGPGPNARRNRTSLFQDGEYQERVFRAVEKQHPTIAHLGNWHTHHVNGLQVLSNGDAETYRRTVNHKNHDTDFFYALLVTSRLAYDGIGRYGFRNYILFRGRQDIYDLADWRVSVSDEPVLALSS